MADGTQEPSNGNGSNGSNGWTTYGKLVLTELERHQDSLDKIDSKIATIKEVDLPNIRTELATLKTKAMLLGAVAGTLFSGLVFAIFSALIHH